MNLFKFWFMEFLKIYFWIIFYFLFSVFCGDNFFFLMRTPISIKYKTEVTLDHLNLVFNILENCLYIIKCWCFDGYNYLCFLNHCSPRYIILQTRGHLYNNIIVDYKIREITLKIIQTRISWHIFQNVIFE